MQQLNPRSSPPVDTIAVIGNYLPRKCGIATFTTDLVQALATQNCRCKAVAINDRREGYNYSDDVRFEINQDELAEYETAARFLNTHEVDAVSLQHEFGIFGGKAGDYILTLLSELNMPVATTLHTVLTDPTKKQMQVMTRLGELSDRLIVMSRNAVDILHTLYNIPKQKITYIPHGIPDMPFVDPNYYKDRYDLLGRQMLLTFGLLSENKGIEYVIEALPKVVERVPELTYIILGATHPQVLSSDGEQYRRKLEHLVHQHDLENHVQFVDEFVPFEELCNYLAATDVYITPYLNEQQITSGTLAYAAGTGKAVISTPYWYAKEMLQDGRGQLVPFHNADAMGEAILELLENDVKRHQLRKKAYDFNRDATWPEVGRQYLDVFKNIKRHQNLLAKIRNGTHSVPSSTVKYRSELPELNLDHLARLTDDTGLLQHATHSVANRNHGYCTDDNARGLIAVVRSSQLSDATKAARSRTDKLATCYLGFLLHAFNRESGRFRNFMSYARRWQNKDAGSEDAHGRALWALGIATSAEWQHTHLPLATSLFMSGLSAAESFQSPRAISFSLLGIDAYLESFSGDSKAKRIYSTLANRLFRQFNDHAANDWPWLEDIVAYANGKLVQALIQAGDTLRREEMQKLGLRALSWLLEIQTSDHHLAPIGNQGWYLRDEHKACFDQQPLEVQCLIDACLAAHKITGENKWRDRAGWCFSWFLGNNDLSTPVYDQKTGGCHDGLQMDNINQNEGAESTLAWLLSLIQMYQLLEDNIIADANEKYQGMSSRN